MDYVPDALESETQTSKFDDLTGSSGTSVVTNKVRIDFDQMTTIYATLAVTEHLYVKAGAVTVDVITKESLGTGSTYGNTSLEGHMMGVGYNHSLDNGLFFRVEGTVMDLGSATVTASNADNKVSLKEVEGFAARISVGKLF